MWKNVPAGSASTSSCHPRRWKSRPSSLNTMRMTHHATEPGGGAPPQLAPRRRHQLPPPPPPPPPPEEPPPENPLEPEPDGVEAIVPPVVTAKPSIESANCA